MNSPSYNLTRLVEARALIEKGWTRRSGARDRFGAECSPYSNDAREFCILGAVNRVCECNNVDNIPKSTEIDAYLKAELPKPYNEYSELKGLYTFNDNVDTTKKMVLALFDRAIAKVKKEGFYEQA